MFTRISHTFNSFPKQFWLVAFGVLISSSGSSLIWPFQLIYISKNLDSPLATAATLISISSFIGLFLSILGGSIADRFGRKPIMIISQAVHGTAYILMSQANTYLGFLLPMILIGAAMPFYAIGSDAMMADLIPPEKRATAYSILRMTNNAGIAIGPSMGGFLISKSYSLAFFGAAAAMSLYSLILIFFSRETLHTNKHQDKSENIFQSISGYKYVLKDKVFIAYVSAITLGMIAPLMMWTLLAVYVKDNFSITEAHYAWLPITNAVMCVFVQYFVTFFTRKQHPSMMIALGMFIYALGVGSVALMSSFTGFWISMVIMTFGELILIPTATAFTATRAPEELRGRYMSVYWLTWGLARTTAPLLGGFLNDVVSPKAVWYGGLLFGVTSTIILLILSINSRQETDMFNH